MFIKIRARIPMFGRIRSEFLNIFKAQNRIPVFIKIKPEFHCLEG